MHEVSKWQRLSDNSPEFYLCPDKCVNCGFSFYDHSTSNHFCPKNNAVSSEEEIYDLPCTD